MMSKLVVVSNRLPSIPADDKLRSQKQNVGGLVSALISALELSGGGMWFGWSGKTSWKRNETLKRLASLASPSNRFRVSFSFAYRRYHQHAPAFTSS